MQTLLIASPSAMHGVIGAAMVDRFAANGIRPAGIAPKPPIRHPR